MGEKFDQCHRARIVERQVNQFDDCRLDALYQGVGSEAYPPVLMLKMVLFEYLQGRLSPAQWHRDASEHDAMRWLGRGCEPSRITWYRFRDRMKDVVKALHEDLIKRAIDDDLLHAEVGVQDGTTVAACASRHRVVNERTLLKRQAILQQAIASDQLGDAPPIDTVMWMPTTPSGREELAERMQQAATILMQRLEQNARKPKGKRKDPHHVFVSLTDPQAAMGRDKFKVFRPLYTIQFMVDSKSLLVLGYLCRPEATDAGTLTPLIDQVQQTVGGTLNRVLADSAYSTLVDLIDCDHRGIDLLAPVQANSFTDSKQKKSGRPKNNRAEFDWNEDQQTYRCPAGHELDYKGKEAKRRYGGRSVIEHRYHCRAEHCQGCPLASGCVKKADRGRWIKRLEGQELLDAQRRKMDGDAIKRSYRERSQVIERAFGDAKRHRNFDHFHGRQPWRAETETGLVVLAQNLLTLDRLQRRSLNPNENGT